MADSPEDVNLCSQKFSGSSFASLGNSLEIIEKIQLRWSASAFIESSVHFLESVHY